MPLRIRRVQVWSGEISDRPGAAAAKLAYLSKAGADVLIPQCRRDRKIRVCRFQHGV